MFRVGLSILLGFAMLVAGYRAQAADMPPIFHQGPPMVEEFGSSWYLRGDIGYRLTSVPSAHLSNGVALVSENYGNTFTGGGGFGLKWNWLRADLTADYGVLTNYRGASALNSHYVNAAFDTLVGLANGYIDLGTWSHITPYVGAGAGMAIIHANKFNSAVDTTNASSQNINFAWAVMAGLGYNVSPNLVVDGGYRYIDLGSSRSGVPPIGPSATFDRFTGHEVRLGFRYMID